MSTEGKTAQETEASKYLFLSLKRHYPHHSWRCASPTFHRHKSYAFHLTQVILYLINVILLGVYLYLTNTIYYLTFVHQILDSCPPPVWLMTLIYLAHVIFFISNLCHSYWAIPHPFWLMLRSSMMNVIFYLTMSFWELTSTTLSSSLTIYSQFHHVHTWLQ